MTGTSKTLQYALVALLVVLAQACQAGKFLADGFLQKYCIECHGGEVQEADLRLDLLGEVEAGKLKQTWHQIFTKLLDREMPPESAKQPTDSERAQAIDSIRETYGEPKALPDSDHWAFQPIERPSVPYPPQLMAPSALLNEAPNDIGAEPLNPIDAFVLARLREHDLGLSQPAGRRELIRRASLDLIGLPPTPDEVIAFVEDPNSLDRSFAEVVDRLLQSPRYGERWAQLWLDVIRWAETVGFETNLERTEAWHYRDWVIRSFNQDKPYDRFILEQLLGDSLGEDAALGFLVAGPANLPGQIGRDEEAMRQARQDELDEAIRTVSQSLFGLTIGCARCHDHKFDPILQSDYYSMQAVFAGLSYGHRRLRGTKNDHWTALVPAAREELRRLEEKLERTRKALDLLPPLETVQAERFEPIGADAVRMEIGATESGAASLYEFEVWQAAEQGQPETNVALARSGAKPSASSFALSNQTRHFDNLVDGDVDRRQAFPWVSAQGGPAWIQIELAEPTTINHVVWHAGSSFPARYEIKVRDPDAKEWRTVAQTHTRLPRVADLRSAKDVQIAGLSPEQVTELFGLLAEIRAARANVNRLTAGPQVFAARFSEDPATTWLLRRGDPMQREQVVPPAVPAFLKARVSPPGDPGPTPAGDSAQTGELERRFRLARHLTSPDHPLTPRVIVNRIWQHHFGVGVVETSSDFGQMGAEPTHPELLDWLASEFVARGWSLKALHRQILTSCVYRQTSRPHPDALAIDAQSRLLWRFPPRRLEAETIRDSVLFVSGKLNQSMYGRGFDFFLQRGGLSDYGIKQSFDESGWRRMIYAHKIRMESVDIFGAFDCPDAGQMTPKRNQSITPIQALGLFNSPFIQRQAKLFAERVADRMSGDLAASVDRAFEIALARRPSANEQSQMVKLAEKFGLEQVCRVILNSSEFVYMN